MTRELIGMGLLVAVLACLIIAGLWRHTADGDRLPCCDWPDCPGCNPF